MPNRSSTSVTAEMVRAAMRVMAEWDYWYQADAVAERQMRQVLEAALGESPPGPGSDACSTLELWESRPGGAGKGPVVRITVVGYTPVNLP
jgi:hypothetical protein